MNINHFFAMGGYAMYVWPAYCITLLVFGINLFSSLKEKHKIKAFIKLQNNDPLK